MIAEYELANKMSNFKINVIYSPRPDARAYANSSLFLNPIRFEKKSNSR